MVMADILAKATEDAAKESYRATCAVLVARAERDAWEAKLRLARLRLDQAEAKLVSDIATSGAAEARLASLSGVAIKKIGVQDS